MLVAGLLVCSCVGKRPDDDVAIVKQVLAVFERGIDKRNEAVLDSAVLDKKQSISSRLLEELLREGEYEGARIASKSFIIVADSAEVRLTLSLEYRVGQEERQQLEKPLSLYLQKKRGEWRIKSFSTATVEGALDNEERP